MWACYLFVPVSPFSSYECPKSCLGTTVARPYKTPSSLGMMRTARIGVLPVLMAILSSDEELSGDLRAGKKLNDAGIMMNVFGRPEEAFSMPWWRDGVNANLSRDSMLRMGERLWDESVKILQLHGH